MKALPLAFIFCALVALSSATNSSADKWALKHVFEHSMWIEDSRYEGPVTAFLPNGDFVTGTYDNDVAVWDTNTWTRKRSINQLNYDGVILLLALSNGDLASANYNSKEAHIWDTQTGLLKQTLEGHTGFVISLAELPNGDLATGSEDKTIKIWDPKTGLLKRTLVGHKKGVRTLKVLANGDLATASFGGYIWGSSDSDSIRVWNGTTGELKSSITECDKALVAFPNGDLGYLCPHGRFGIWDSSQGHMKRLMDTELEIPYGLISSSRLSLTPPPHEYLVLYGKPISSYTSDRNHQVKIWNPKTGDLKHILVYPEAYKYCEINDLVVLPNGDIAAASSSDASQFLITIWDSRTGLVMQTLTGHPEPIFKLIVLPNGDLLSASSDWKVRIWSLA